MGVRERRREKEKKPDEVETAAEIESIEIEPAASQEIATEAEIHSPEVIVEKEIIVEQVEESATIAPELKVQTVTTLPPPWGDINESEWMYGVPERENDRSLWAEEWGDYLLQWTQFHSIHILSISTFIGEPPFNEMKNKVDAFKTIAEGLIEKGVAEWTEKRKRQLRIYWRPLEEWADILYEWCMATGKLRLDVKSIVIQEVDKDFAKLPEKDLYIVLALMVEKGYAEWVDKKKGAVMVDI